MTGTDTIGQRLRAQRTKLGLTLAQVAERAEVSLPYLSNLERGRGNPTMDVLGRLAEALETSLSALVEVSGDAAPLDAMLGTPPGSLVRYMRTPEFEKAVEKLAGAQAVAPDEMRQRLVMSMSTAPRRSSGEPSEADWRRLLDTYSLILGSD
jgi:transcriptional regulator with XRE-family HTH domain